MSNPYFDRDGLRVKELAEDVMDLGPLAQGSDDRMWSYEDGVWSPDPFVVRKRVATLMGNGFRRSHATNAEDMVKAEVATITSEPVPHLINFKNGLFRWKTDRLYRHTPKILSTVQLAVDYQPDATCPQFDQFLSEVVPEDMIDMVWELIGYLMCSGNPLHKAVMLTGTGRNGKGTFLRVIGVLLGRRNVTAVSLHDLTNTRFSTASLFGKLANIAGDIDGSYLENTAMFKAITGEDSVSAEHKGRDRFDFTPWAVPVFSANKIPGSADVTVGYLARWVIVPFPNSFLGREDPGLTGRLLKVGELEGIAAHGVRSLRELMKRKRFEAPESAKEATQAFERAVDQVKTWVNECCELHEQGAFAARTRLYDEYQRWAQRDRYRPVKAGEFYARLDAMEGLRATKRRGERGYGGIRVIESVPR